MWALSNLRGRYTTRSWFSLITCAPHMFLCQTVNYRNSAMITPTHDVNTHKHRNHIQASENVCSSILKSLPSDKCMWTTESLPTPGSTKPSRPNHAPGLAKNPLFHPNQEKQAFKKAASQVKYSRNTSSIS